MSLDYLIRTYSIYGIPIRISCPKGAIYNRITTLFKQLKFAQHFYHNQSLQKPIVIIISKKNRPIPINAEVTIRCRLCNIKVICKNDTIFFTNGQTVFVIHHKDSNATLYLEREILFRHNPSLEQFILSGILELLRWRGLHSLHAAGIYKDNLKILLMGNSGCGKSTVALSLIFQGWKFLSDDLLFIKESGKCINVFSTATELIFNPKIFHNCQILVKIREYISRCSYNNRKSTIDIAKAYPKQVIRHFNPNVILFFKIVHQKKSCLVPITKRLALFKLINQSVFLSLGGTASQKYLTVLNKLAIQTMPFQLLIGRDLYKNPFKILDIISTIKLSP